MIRETMELYRSVLRTIYRRLPHKKAIDVLSNRVTQMLIENQRIQRDLSLQRITINSIFVLAVRLQNLELNSSKKIELLQFLSHQESLLAVDSENIFYLTPMNDQIITPHINRTGYWEKNVSKLLEEILVAKKTFVVIGANFGFHAIQQSRINPNLRVIAIEPHPKTFELLKINCLLNNVTVETINLAITQNKGTVILYESEFNGGNNRIEPFLDSHMVGSVTSDSIKNLLEKLDTNADVFLIDTQGSEIEIVFDVFAMQKTKTICVFELDLGGAIYDDAYLLELEKKISYEISFSILDEAGNLFELKKNEFMNAIRTSLNKDLIIMASN